MKISLMSIAFRNLYREGTMEVSDFVRYCAQLKLDGVEITCSDEEGIYGKVEQALEETGLIVSSYNLNLPLLSVDKAERTAAWRAFQEGVRRAKALVARSVMLFPSPLEYTDPDEERRKWIEMCRECAGYAEDEGVLLTMENVGFPKGIPLCGKVTHMREIVEGVGSPSFRLTFDTGNFIMAGEDPVAAFRSLAPFVAHMHLKDVVVEEGVRGERYTEVAIGTGIMDFQPIVEGLRARGYTGFLSMECAGPGDRAAKERMVEVSLQNTRGMLSDKPRTEQNRCIEELPGGAA